MRRRMEAPFSTFVREYSRHDALAGKSVIITGTPGEPAITGRCEGVDHFGRLMVRHRAKLHTIVAGTVAIVSPTSGAGYDPRESPRRPGWPGRRRVLGSRRALTRKIRRQADRSANVIPPGIPGIITRTLWFPVVFLWIFLPLLGPFLQTRSRLLQPIFNLPLVSWIASQSR